MKVLAEHPNDIEDLDELPLCSDAGDFMNSLNEVDYR